MSGIITAREFDLIRDYIQKETAISLAEDKVYLVETRLSEIMKAEGLTGYSALYEALQDSRQKVLRDTVIDAMTTNETLWFRDTLPFDAFRDVLLPAYAAEIREGKRDKIRIWSAASSTGQEAYSMAMVFREAARKNSALKMEQLEIVASDLSDSALAMARAGVYAGIAMDRGLPPEYKERYFEQRGESYQISPEIQDRVTFRKFNLQDTFVTLGKFDVILTRYVLIYFDDDFKREVLRKAHGALEGGGVVFLGSSESLPEETPGYAMVQRGRATWYQKMKARTPEFSLGKSPAVPKPSKTVEASNRPAPSPSDSQSHLEGLEKATSNLADVMERLREMNNKHSLD